MDNNLPNTGFPNTADDSAPGIVNSSEYLAQIAPPSTEIIKSQWPKRFLGIFLAIATLSALFFAVYLALSDPRPELRAVASDVDLRIAATRTLAQQYQPYLRASATRTLNGELATFLTDFQRDFSVVLSSSGASAATPQAIPPFLAEHTARLDRDFIVSTLDRNFPNLIVYHIDMLRAQIISLEVRLDNVQQRQLLREADTRLRDFRTQYLAIITQ
ncbi:hypothetical protein FWH13_03095 [Candidatus Saccharibacteria bacterium]|nr:hypothetical protein [Candidatus Saccharibacteria bacterium]